MFRDVTVRQLAVFAKYWTPGTVKTRLAAAVGDEGAARFQQACVESVLCRFRTTGHTRVLCYAPDDQRDGFEASAGADWQLQPQGGGDLGARMRRYFESVPKGTTAVPMMKPSSPSASSR